MSYVATLEVRNNLTQNAAITTLAPASNIRVGWPREIDAWPAVLITQTSGYDKAKIGYKTTAAGSRYREESINITIDIFSRTSRLQTLQIADAIVPVMIASSSAVKTGDLDDYDSDSDVYRKIQTYQFYYFHETD